jgi:hypothetical protein
MLAQTIQRPAVENVRSIETPKMKVPQSAASAWGSPEPPTTPSPLPRGPSSLNLEQSGDIHVYDDDVYLIELHHGSGLQNLYLYGPAKTT